MPEYVRFDSLKEYFELKEKAKKWDKVMEVYHKDNERFVQFANTMSKVRELEGEGGKG